VLQPDERTPAPRPRPAREGAPLTDADMADALKTLREWAGFGLVALADKHEGLSKSTISVHERGGQPTAKFLDAFVPTCLNNRGGFTPEQILTELRYWHQARKTLDRMRRNSAATVPSPQPDPTPADISSAEAESDPIPAVRDDTIHQAALEPTNGADSPDPAPDVTPEPEGASGRGAGLTPSRRLVVVAAAIVVAVGIVGVLGLLGLHGPDTASGADKQSSLRAVTPTQRLVDSPPYVAGMTYSETVNSLTGARTYTDPSGMVGEGDQIPNHMAVRVSCKVVAPGAASVGIYWYRIADLPWKGSYAPTNSFANDDPISGSHKKAVDESVPYCPS
jgi:hypothetical protein